MESDSQAQSFYLWKFPVPSSACDLMGILLEDHVLLELITLCGVENRDIHDPPTDNECSIPHQILQYRFIQGSTQRFEDSFGGQSNAQHCFTPRWCDERQRAMANGELSGFFLSDLIYDRTQQRTGTLHRTQSPLNYCTNHFSTSVPPQCSLTSFSLAWFGPEMILLHKDTHAICANTTENLPQKI